MAGRGDIDLLPVPIVVLIYLQNLIHYKYNYRNYLIKVATDYRKVKKYSSIVANIWLK